MSEKHRVVIIGGGFGGLIVPSRSARRRSNVTLIDRRNFHLFQPLLYQAATGGLSPANIAAPLRSVLHRHSNTAVLMVEVCGFDLAGRRRSCSPTTRSPTTRWSWPPARKRRTSAMTNRSRSLRAEDHRRSDRHPPPHAGGF